MRPQDERFWEQYRTTPKAFVSLEAGQRLWRSRYGELTSFRVRRQPRACRRIARETQFLPKLRSAIDPLALGLAVSNVRAQSLAASRGATDFGEYFVYFSFFLVVSALVLAALFFKLGVEQRVREVGLLRAVGFGPAQVRRQFLGEGLLLAVAGGVLGVLGALGVCRGHHVRAADVVGGCGRHDVADAARHADVVGCGRDWRGRRRGRLHLVDAAVAQPDLGAEPAGWEIARADDGAAGCQHPPLRNSSGDRGCSRVIGVALLGAGSAGWIAREGAFFGAGSALLVASLCLFFMALRRHGPSALDGTRLAAGVAPGLPIRAVSSRAQRVVDGRDRLGDVHPHLGGCVPTWRRRSQTRAPHSGVGGYSAVRRNAAAGRRRLNSRAARDAMNLFDLDPAVTLRAVPPAPGRRCELPESVRAEKPEDSRADRCVPGQRPLCVSGALANDRCRTRESLAAADREEADGAVPVIADANSMTYVLHKQLGEDMVIKRGGREIRLRLVGALRDSIFQGELLMSQANFIRLFPDSRGIA